MGLRLLVAFLAAVALSAAAQGAEASLGFARPIADSRLEAGSNAEVVWSLPSGAADFDEMELVLSLDGGRTFPLRVTADVSKAAGKFFWRVPALTTEHARLALRTGLDERVDSEMIQFLGPEFAIARAAGDPLEELFRVKREWRTREALTSPADPPFETGLADGPADHITAAGRIWRATRRPRPFAHPQDDRSANAVRPAESTPRPMACLDRVLRPLSIPLRQ